MTPILPPEDDRRPDLLAAEATEGLDLAARMELERRLVADPDDADALALAAAALELGLNPLEATDVSPDLLARLEQDAKRFFAKPRPAVAPPPRRWHAAAGWAATAACLALWWWTARPAAPLTPERQREQLLADASARRYRGPDGGDLIWSDATQHGVLAVRGLPANDPAVSRYQLWIVDADRAGPPVDGGLFDVPAGDTALVPVRPTLPVGRAAIFAVTREVPRGVVVSAGPHVQVFQP